MFVGLFYAGEMKQKITEAFLQMNKSEKWHKELAAFNIWGFKTIDSSLYDEEVELKKLVKDMVLRPTYY